jgi:hypothetical protein
MKRILAFLFLLTWASSLSAQLPSLTGATLLKFQQGNNTWLQRLDSLQIFFSAGAGTVTSVALSPGSTGFSVSGSPITTNGTFTLSGTLVAANGGTGQSSYTTGDILYASSSSALSKLAGVATGNALISGGVGTAPSYGKITPSHISGTWPVANGGTGLTAVGGDGTLLGSNGSAAVYLNPSITTNAAIIGWTRNGTNLELNIPNADGSNRGVVSTGSQTMAGAKTFSSLLTGSAGVSASSSASAAAFDANGVTATNWTAITATTTADHTHNFFEIGTLSSGITLNLPACNATRNKWEYKILKAGADDFGLTIDPSGSEQFTDGSTTKTLYSQGNSATCKCKWNGSSGAWYFIP